MKLKVNRVLKVGTLSDSRIWVLMKRILDIGAVILASLRPSSNKLEIDSYGQSSLPEEEVQNIMEWLFATLMNAGYFGKAHLIWDTGNQSWDTDTVGKQAVILASLRHAPDPVIS